MHSRTHLYFVDQTDEHVNYYRSLVFKKKKKTLQINEWNNWQINDNDNDDDDTAHQHEDRQEKKYTVRNKVHENAHARQKLDLQYQSMHRNSQEMNKQQQQQ